MEGGLVISASRDALVTTVCLKALDDYQIMKGPKFMVGRFRV